VLCESTLVGSSPTTRPNLIKFEMDKKSKTLSIRYSTANARLIRDLLFKFVTDAGHVCFRCGKRLTRGEFSVDHKQSWISAPDPAKAFFDLEGIAFSHIACNSLDPVNRLRKYATKAERKIAMAENNKRYWQGLSPEERQRRRRKQYELHGT
jgi:hypothetical protein